MINNQLKEVTRESRLFFGDYTNLQLQECSFSIRNKLYNFFGNATTVLRSCRCLAETAGLSGRAGKTVRQRAVFCFFSV